jgi:ArsR family transcriptional regulator
MGDLFFQASDPTRLIILLRLQVSSLCVCELSQEMGLSVSAVSHQLKKLRLAGLVSRKREGRHIRYSLADDHVRQLLKLGLEHIRE